MSRDALVVGINTYERLTSLNAPSEDAEAIAQLLSEYGEFNVKRLPAVKNKHNNTIQVGQKTKVTLTQLEEAIVQLFKPEGKHIPDTALLYFSGHGLRKDRGIQEGFLATSDVNPDLGNWGLSLQWLRRLLQESPVRQQIIWLDCCYSGEMLNFAEADPGDRGKGRDRCFIAASREFEVAYEGIDSNHSVLTIALLKGLEPKQERWVSNYTLVDFLNQESLGFPQRPIFANSGEPINLTRQWKAPPEEPAAASLPAICPYKGLAYFDCEEEDAKYFYGRRAQTDDLLEKVRQGNFLAVLGASGSGKSSVVRAGLLYQLKQGRRLSGSDRWQIHILRPGEHPLQSLALAFLEPGLSEVDRATQFAKAKDLIGTGAVGLECLIAASTASRVMLVVDQFEEVFTLCRDSTERQQFFECLLGALERTGNKLCLVLAMRADFFGKCAEQEYAGLATQIEKHLVTVKPMKREELEQAITEPAKQVGLEVEQELVTQMIADVDGSPGSLPLLQYTLTELWNERTNRLTLSTYARLGGVKGTLQKRATEVFESLSEQEQQVAKRIFLELTQLGEGTEDTRRQVFKRDLVSLQQSEVLVEQVLQKLADAKLVVTSELIEKGAGAGRVAVVDIAHEALIRHWSLLREWVNENREAIRIERKIEEAAEEWLRNGKPEEMAYLLQGSKLTEAENFLQDYADTVLFSSLAREFIQVSQQERDRILREEEARLHRELEQERKARRAAQRAVLGVGVALLAVLFSGGFTWWRQEKIQQAVYDAWSQFKGTAQGSDTLSINVNFLDEAQRRAQSYQRRGDVNRSLAYYRQIRADTIKFLSESSRNSNNPNVQSVLQKSTTAENSLAKLIQEYRLGELKEKLQQGKFGKKRLDYNLTDFENRFTPGALQITYKVLMRDLGAGADLNQDGQLNNKDEAAQIPCETLREIERLWRDATRGRCGWYGSNSNYIEYPTNCDKLNGLTLTKMLFNIPVESPIINRLEFCQVTAKPANTNGM
jgi:energy-coupling factor transporter ATP-binding protein EcfA2